MGPVVAPLSFTFEDISSLLRVEPSTGNLYWKQPGRGRQLGKPAGSFDRRGYVTLTIKYKRVRAHNLVWLLTTGEWPKEELDHINHDNSDNRFENLRDCSASENNLNRRCVNKYGYPGIFRERRSGRYRSTYIRKVLGYFDTPEEAIAARKNYEKELQGANPR